MQKLKTELLKSVKGSGGGGGCNNPKDPEVAYLTFATAPLKKTVEDKKRSMPFVATH
ncbi:hypothetical protein [Pseudoalteromonas rubra]|uniref:hypothetical protein n=1 Tax=Pseudoalteromonas rubra TaxID=43658 RepID=UPI0013EEA873|nr:hypothetical protein [Pseudoalteromonas rubra]